MDLKNICGKFQIPGKYIAGSPHGAGHINDTHAVVFRDNGKQARYILQRLNENIFKNPEAVMENISRVLSHLANKISAGEKGKKHRRYLSLIPAKDGRPFYVGPAGNFWRMYPFIENTHAVSGEPSPFQAREAGRAFGRFIALMADFPPENLHETILHFHDINHRFYALQTAIERDPTNRASVGAQEIEFALSRRDAAMEINRIIEKGDIFVRVVHNDTKLNNVLFDNETKKGVCVIDLDTVMPGTVLDDFGDLARSVSGRMSEDGRNVRFDPVSFKAVSDAFLKETKEMLVPDEIGLLAAAVCRITLELGIRFLTDYLCGDTYFKVLRPDHNLIRCRKQFRLLSDMERRKNEMETIIRAV